MREKTKETLNTRLKTIRNNVEKIAVLSPDRYLHIGIDEGGILGAPSVFLAFDKKEIPIDDVQYLGIMHNRAIKKYLTAQLFIFTVLGFPDYSEKLNVQFKK